MRYLSLFSGIESATVAWKALGWECVGVAEIEPFPCAVLAHHYPNVPNLGSVTEITEDQIQRLGKIDLVVGGFPCQDLSVAGKRAGLAGERSGLFHEGMRIFDATRTLCGARWLLIENVPGMFSSHKGADFAVVVSEMAGADFDVPKGKWQKAGVAVGDNGLVEWRVLDAQFTRVESHPRAVPQRRRRVFALLDTGDWANRPPVLLEPESLRGDSAPRRETGKISAPGTGASTAFGGNNTTGSISVATAVNAHGGPHGRLDFESETFIAFHNRQDPDVSGPVTHPLGAQDNGMAVAFSCKDHGADAGDVAPTLRSMNFDGSHANGGGQVAVAFSAMPMNSGKNYTVRQTDVAQPLTTVQAGNHNQGGDFVLAPTMSVRRLLPVECEALQGFPRGYTATPFRNKPAADGPRYKALGNSMAVNVMRFIGQRIQEATK